jgi:DNA-binding beta-propeller fold protein YncE
LPQTKEKPSVHLLKPDKLIGITLGIKKPTGISLDWEGNLYIVDSGNDRLLKTDNRGDLLAEVGGFGWDNGQFNQPSQVASDQGLNIYVADTYNKRVQRFDRNLNFISVITLDSPDKSFGLIQGIAVTKSGELYIADTDNDRVIRLDNFFGFKSGLGDYSYGVGALLRPSGLALDRGENLYVCDSEKNRIAVFDPFGNYLKEIKDSSLKNPRGVCVSQDGSVYVANTGNNNILIFNSSGEKILEFGSLGKEIGNFSSPADLKIYQDKWLYVADGDNDRIQVLEILR